MILAVDLGSSSFKAGIYDETLELLGESSYMLKYEKCDLSNFSLGIDEVTHGFRTCIAKCLEDSGFKPLQIKAVAITGQAQTFCLMDRYFRSLTQFISWRDTGSIPTIRQLEQILPWSEFSKHCSFPRMVPGLQLSSFLHLMTRRLLPTAGDFLVMPLHSYLIFLLSGQYVTDDNMAAMTGFYSLYHHCWWGDALNFCGLTPDQLPVIHPAGNIVAETIDRNVFGLPKKIKIVSAGNDQTTGAFGAGISESDIYLSLGTAYVAYGIFDTLPEVNAADARGIYYNGKFYRLAVANSGGNDLCRLADQFAGGNFDLFFANEASKSLPECKLEMILKDIKSAVSAVDNNPKRLLICGGGSRSEIFTQMLGDIFSIKTEKNDSTPLLGTAKTVIDKIK